MNLLKQEQRAKRASEAIAHFRKELSEKGCEIFTIKELGAGLSRNNCPYVSPNLFAEFIKRNIIVSAGKRGEYVFKESNPIYFKVVSAAIDTVANYRKTLEKPEDEVKSFILTESQAIAFLKEKGYKIKKPIVSYEDI